MGAVYDEFTRELSDWDRKYAGKPAQEIIKLFLLALEREQIVSIAYSEDVLEHRLSALAVPGDVRDIFRSALVWAWKDESMHAIYVRGALLKYRNLALRTLAFSKQAAGAIGGWAASVRQHLLWTEAPVSSTLAAAVTWAGYLTGKVPGAVRKHLDYGSFRDFCRYNEDAEQTAWLCFKRLGELARQDSGIGPTLIEDIDRMQEDEDRHRRVFSLLAESLTDRDELVEGVTAATLAERVRDVSDVFLPRSLRHGIAGANPLGSGGKVWVRKGHRLSEKLSIFRDLLVESELRALLESRAEALGKPVRQLHVAIKPTFMMGYHLKDMSPVTDPELVEELARHVRNSGCEDIAVVEQRNIYDHFYRNRTVANVARYLGFRSELYRVVDVSEEQVPHSYDRGLGQYSVGRTWKDSDFRISFSKLRSHPVELVYLSVANTEGLGARCDEFFFAERQSQRQTANMMLLDQFPPHFALLDGYDRVPDGILGMMGCPQPKTPMRYYAGEDALAVDLVAARHIGLNEIRDSSSLREACHWFGDPTNHIQVAGFNEPIPGWRSPYH
ncbi:MAG TPA: DUF362 domain-containing protein, partial [Blastocatellia bacterium]|nr:DUF362 domain-containing protein [Blastocatellia bacterium]